MRNLRFFLSLCLLMAVPAMAEETSSSKVSASDENSQIVAAVIDEQQVEIVASETEVITIPEFVGGVSPRPECSDSLLVQKIVENIGAYQAENPATMLIDRRRDILLRRNLSRFEEVEIKGFSAKQNFNVANAIIMTKINRGLDDEDLRLCRSLGRGKAADIYVLIYPVGEGNVVDIINFLPEGSDKGILSFIYN